MKRRTLGIDLAKDCFQVSVSDGAGRVTERHRLNRDQFTTFMAQSPVSRVLLEACGSAHRCAEPLHAYTAAISLLPGRGK